jgi:two-component sensor histidine kinase
MSSTQDLTTQEELLEQQRVLAEFGERALQADDLDVILSEACILLGRALKTELAKVMESLSDGRTMRVRTGVGWKPGVVGEVKISADQTSPEGITLKDGAVISSDFQAERRFSYHGFMIEHGVKAFVNVLISSREGDTPFGVLEVDSRAPRDFRRSDIDFLKTYANLLGAAIGRFRTTEQLRSALRDKELLMLEMNHRVKNTLAAVQAIVSQSLRTAASPDEVRDAIDSRLAALAKVHDVLMRENWEAANLPDVVGRAIEPYDAGEQHRIQTNGPNVRVPARVALTLALTFQELATNAVKYGALSNDVGEVRLSWEPAREGDGRVLKVTWQEVGGPPVQKPSRRGFGTRLMERSLAGEAGSNLQMDFAPAGLLCTFSVPFEKPAL